MMRPFSTPAVAAAFDAFPTDARIGLLALRDLILETAWNLPQIGVIEEALRWGQPAYLTPATKSGSTIRLGIPKAGGFALFAHCQTNIISSFAAAFPGQDRIEGNRAVLFDDPTQIDPARHAMLIKHALTYHL
ncbi:MAG: DUF1801 domain-containing protein [Pseudorhodobacter sp.]